MFEIGDKNEKQDIGENQMQRELNCRAIARPQKRKQQRICNFHERRAQRNRRVAVGASAAQDEIGQRRDLVERGARGSAKRALGRAEDRAMMRQVIGKAIDERAEKKAEEGEEDYFHVHCSQVNK